MRLEMTVFPFDNDRDDKMMGRKAPMGKGKPAMPKGKASMPKGKPDMAKKKPAMPKKSGRGC